MLVTTGLAAPPSRLPKQAELSATFGRQTMLIKLMMQPVNWPASLKS